MGDRQSYVAFSRFAGFPSFFSSQKLPEGLVGVCTNCVSLQVQTKIGISPTITV